MRTNFDVGNDVEFVIVGKVKHIEIDENGKIVYTIELPEGVKAVGVRDSSLLYLDEEVLSKINTTYIKELNDKYSRWHDPLLDGGVFR